MLRLTIIIIFLITIQTGEIFAKYVEKYTPAEVKALEQFRPLVKNLVKKDYEKKDIYLIHWLRAKDLNIQDAKEMLAQNMAWRAENKVDTILQDKNMIELSKLYPITNGKIKDKEGRPTMLTPYAEWDIRKGKLAGHDFKRYQVHNFEEATRNAFENDLSQMFFLVDMNQYNLRQHACLACVSFYVDLVTQYEAYYPNTAHRIFLLNTPRVFETVLKIITRLMSKHTKEVMTVFGVNKEEWQGEMLKYYNAAELPRQYGGTLKS